MTTDFPDEWIMVDQLKPVDLSNISDKGMQGVVLLAVALGWNLVQQRGAPARLRSRSGITRNIPTDTGVRQSVFWSTLANILGHSEGRLPTTELLEVIVKQTGMSKAHAQVLISKVGVLASTNPKTLEIEEEPEPEPIIPIIEEARASVALDGETQSVEFVPTERVEPTLNMASSDGGQYISRSWTRSSASWWLTGMSRSPTAASTAGWSSSPSVAAARTGRCTSRLARPRQPTT
jgi:hypothetical protein